MRVKPRVILVAALSDWSRTTGVHSLQINRLLLGILVAGPTFVVVFVGLSYVELLWYEVAYRHASEFWKANFVLAALAGCGVFWAAERLGVLAEPKVSKTFSLRDD
jgi:hypothetical protein